jgi:perosamine synthetase
MIVTDSEEFRDKLRSLRNLAFRPAPGRRFIHDEIGWNFRMSSLQAALGNSQLNRMWEVTEEKRRIGLSYSDLLAGNEFIQMQPTETEFSKNKFWVVGVLLDPSLDASLIAGHLKSSGIETRPFFYPLHLQPLLERYGLARQPELPVAERLGRSGIYLPSFVGITPSEIERSATALLSTIETLVN